MNKHKFLAPLRFMSSARTIALANPIESEVVTPITEHLTPVMNKKDRLVFFALVSVWALALFLFWSWWLDGDHVKGNLRFLVNTAILAWTTILPGYYFFFVSKMKKANPSTLPPTKLRLAMVVTKAPSEPLELVKKTLLGCLNQDMPHDTWLADESPDEETIKWCMKQKIFLSTRKDNADYHRAEWPRRTRCKEGNLSYFYDHWGYANYDVVVQLDADHTPAKGYLEAMVAPFVNPEVGYVSAPSICDSNKDTSWAARARLYAESTMHGSLQFGYSDGWAPLCIGSHYAVRTKALQEIGGLGPELAEDHSTTLMMNAHGWVGVHSFNAVAHGEGPTSFVDCMTQEFQWSRSLVVILFRYTPQYLGKLGLKTKFQFLFSQIWYPVFSLVMLLSIAMPIIALATNTPWVQVPYISFLYYSTLVTLSSLAIVWWVKSKGWLRPVDAKIVSWETFLFQLARWPWILFGSAAAILGVLTGKNFSFKVTPKGNSERRPLSVRVLMPYLVIIAVSASATLYINGSEAAGYYYLALTNTLLYTILTVSVVALHIKENYA